MKKIFQLIILIFLASACKSQDITTKTQDLIILKDGNEINAQVMEINLSDIKYKKLDNPGGPSYSVQKSEVFMIKYKNGTKDIINKVKETEQETKTSIPSLSHPSVSNTSISNKSLTTKGVVELGGDISYISQTAAGNSSSINVFSFSPTFGFILANGFELSLITGISSSGRGGGQTLTDFNFFIAPTFNISAGKAYPFFQFLFGYNSIGLGTVNISGVGVGGCGGVKVQVGENAAIIFGLRYLNQTYKQANSNNATSVGINTLSLEIGGRIFIFPKK